MADLTSKINNEEELLFIFSNPALPNTPKFGFRAHKGYQLINGAAEDNSGTISSIQIQDTLLSSTSIPAKPWSTTNPTAIYSPKPTQPSPSSKPSPSQPPPPPSPSTSTNSHAGALPALIPPKTTSPVSPTSPAAHNPKQVSVWKCTNSISSKTPLNKYDYLLY